MQTNLLLLRRVKSVIAVARMASTQSYILYKYGTARKSPESRGRRTSDEFGADMALTR
jgi:hypothetical protein